MDLDNGHVDSRHVATDECTIVGSTNLHVRTRQEWQEDWPEELSFWETWIAAAGGRWHGEFATRIDPESGLQDTFAECLDRSLSRHRLLDVGAGPLTMINKKCDFTELEIHAVDPLADDYNRLLHRHGIEPPVRTQRLDGEKLTQKYERGFFDVSYSRNAIDHAYDPLKIIAEMIEVTKEQGHVILQMGVHVGSHNCWRGLHKWDFWLKKNRLLLGGQAGSEIDVTAVLKDSADLVRATVEGGMMTVVLRKRLRPSNIRSVDRLPALQREEESLTGRTATVRRHEGRSTTSDGFSNLLDLATFLDGQDDYVILKLPESFPDYRDHSDLDILCADRDRFRNHVLQVGKAYEDRGFRIEVTEDGRNLHIDFFAPGAERLNFRFDLLDRLDYEKVRVAPPYADVVLHSAQCVSHGGVSVCVPALEHDLAIRLLEYVEYRDRRPDKVKHWDYVRAHYVPTFVDVVNRYTDLNVTAQEACGALNLHVDRQHTGLNAVQRETPRASSPFYGVSETCQIPNLDAIYQEHFGRRTDGCFVEVGAFDGEYVSNTSGLADMGWTGYYIEPVPEYAQRCQARHAKNSRVTVSQVAIGAEPATVDINVAGPLSTISERARQNFQSLDWAKRYFARDAKMAVSQLPLNEYLEQHGVQPGFEVLSIDVEGYEWEVVRSFDIGRWRPQMVVIELHDQNDSYLVLREGCKKIVQYFSEHNYEPIYKDSSNTIYIPAALPTRRSRMDYFLIWGHGLPHTREIVDVIRDVDDFEIITIVKKHVGDMKRFVQDIYACDTVPFKHLVAKTQYLLDTTPEIVFILVRNTNPQEKYFGEGAFRHIQCQLVKDVKEKIRNRFNPRVGGKRTENHVIHASDYESQVAHVLGVLGLQPIEHYLRQPNPDLDVPFHIKPFDNYVVKEVPVDDLHANILGVGLVPLTETPHYRFLTGDRKPYELYHERYVGTKLTDDHFPEAYDRMISAFEYDGQRPDGRRSLILAQDLGDGTYRILDGVHRAAILKHRGAAMVTIAEPGAIAQPVSSQAACVGVIFSKDRAMQLRATLESFMLHCGDAERVNLSVLYTTSDARHRRQYDQLKEMFSGVRFVEERDLKSQTLSILDGSQYVLFLVDDNIFVRPFRIQDVTATLEKEEDALGFSLRLGTNTDYCYTLDRPQAVPAFEEVDVDMLKCMWPTAECDFSYPLEISSSVFRTTDILPLVRETDFQTPNQLEVQLSKHRSRCHRRPRLLTFRQSATFCNPVNVVQSAYPNRHGVVHPYTAAELAEQFDRGGAIDVEKYIGFVPRAAHQEVELCFRPGALHGFPSCPARAGGEPLVTVFTVTYNTERYLRSAIESVLAQDYTNIEYLVIDDGSTDGTRAIVASYNDPRISYVYREHTNFASGMNEAVRRAKGTFVLGVDADDYIDPHYVRHMVEYATKHPQYDYYYPQTLAHVDKDNQRLASSYRYEQHADSREILRLVLQRGYGVVPNPGSLKRRSLFERTGFYRDVSNVEDFVYLTENALRIRYRMVPDNPLYYYRRVEGHGNTLQYETRHRIMAKAMYDMIMANDPLIFCPELQTMEDSTARKKAFLTVAANVMEHHARRNQAREGSHFAEYAEKIRERLRDMEAVALPCRTGSVSSTRNRRPTIAVLPHMNNLSFMDEILARLRTTHDVWVVDCNEPKDIARALTSADVCWIEWATDFAVRVTELPRHCRTILRLHSFEAFRSAAQRIHWENVDDLVFVSPHIREVLKSRVLDIETRVRTHVIPNCVDLAKFHFQDRARGKKIAFVGALRPAKNIPFLMQCFREIHAADAGYTLHVAGELFGDELLRNELHCYIEHATRELGIQDHVRFYGHVQDVSSWLDAKDFILSTSIREGHAVNIIEGMAKGLKPVIHNFPGAKDCYPHTWIFDTAQECRDIVLSPHFDRQEYRTFIEEHWSAERVLPQIDALLALPGPSHSGDRLGADAPADSVPRGAVNSTSASGPRISIITACRNAEEFLPECLDSILAQTMSDWELFLIDDQSTDGTRRIIEQYAGRDGRIRPYYYEDNAGPYIRRNFAIEHARAPFVVIQDADDVMCPEKLEQLHQAIRQDDRLGVVGSFYRMFLDEYRGTEHCEDIALATTQEQILKEYRAVGKCDFCWHGSAIIRKQLFKDIGPYDENPFASDSYWLAKAAEYACRSDEVRLKNIPVHLTLRRMHAASQTGSLPTFDPRSRRVKFREYRRSRLSEVVRKLDTDPHADVKTELRRSVCNDFVAKNRHLFTRWEGARLTSPMVRGFLGRIYSQFAQGQFVRCIVTCGIVERLVEGISERVRSYDLVKGLAYFALAYPQESSECLNREWHRHGTHVADYFRREYVDRDDGQWARAQRVGFIREAVSGVEHRGESRPVTCLLQRIGERPTALSIVMPLAEDKESWAEVTASLNTQTEKDFEVIALTRGVCEHDLESFAAAAGCHLTVLAAAPDAAWWELRNAAADRAQGRCVAFLGEHVLPGSDFVERVSEHFKGKDIRGLRGRITCHGSSSVPTRFDLGPSVLYASCDIDELCVFERETFCRLGGFARIPFERGAIQLSCRIYAEQKNSQGPILYCPDVVARYTGRNESPAWLLDPFVMENRFAIGQLEHDSLARGFTGFVESLYPGGEWTHEERCRQSLDNSLLFEKRYPRLAMDWAEKALSRRPDCIMASYIIGSSLATLGQRDRACRFLDEILDPLEDLLGLERLNGTQREFTDFADIVQCYVAACTLLAQCLMKTGRHDRVMATYARLLDNRHVRLDSALRRSIEHVRDQLAYLPVEASASAPSHVSDDTQRLAQKDLGSVPTYAGQTPPSPLDLQPSGDATLDEQRVRVLTELERKYRSMGKDAPAKHAIAVRLSELYRRAGWVQKSKMLEAEAQMLGNVSAYRKPEPTIVAASAPPSPKPKVTVIAACRDVERYLPECLDSILRQTLPEWELFLLDDGSTDGTRQIIEEYAGRDARIKPHYFDDSRGPYVRRNFAIERANAPFIVIQDADDLMSPVKLETLYNEISDDDSLAMVGSFYRIFLGRFSDLERTDPIELPLGHDEIAKKMSSWRHGISHISAIIRKSMFERIGPYDENPFGSDAFWSAKLAEYAQHCPDVRFKNVPAYLTLYRVHGASQTQVLSTVDPRNRRTRYHQYCECKLRRVRDKVAACPTLDIAAELRACTCSDFLTRFKAQIIMWESEAVQPEVVRLLLGKAAALFDHGCYVSCVNVLNGLEVMDRGIMRRVVNFDFIKAMALYALDEAASCKTSLEREIGNHRNPTAQRFLDDYFEKGVTMAVREWCTEYGSQVGLQIVDVPPVALHQQAGNAVVAQK